ncbi:MAG: hypothetical protein FWG61_08320 [Firmicutes bacterium]|nr:hypothetical protein [Bacillota bacterium]
MRIQNNIMALNAHRQYTINNNNLAKSIEKLSSGYRINRAGDDAAGLAISEKMRAQIRGLNMASKNSQDAISLVQTAEGALQTSHDILQRMRELAVQSASDTNETTIDRTALEKEFQQLIAEIDDTASKTRFNDQNLIDGTFMAQKAIAAKDTSLNGVVTLDQVTALAAAIANGGTVSAAVKSVFDTEQTAASAVTAAAADLLAQDKMQHPDNSLYMGGLSSITLKSTALIDGDLDTETASAQITAVNYSDTSPDKLMVTFNIKSQGGADLRTITAELTIPATGSSVQIDIAGEGSNTGDMWNLEIKYSEGTTAQTLATQIGRLTTDPVDETAVDTNTYTWGADQLVWIDKPGDFTSGSFKSALANGEYTIEFNVMDETKTAFATAGVRATIKNSAGDELYNILIDADEFVNGGAGEINAINLNFGAELGKLEIQLKNTADFVSGTTLIKDLVEAWNKDMGIGVTGATQKVFELGGGADAKDAVTASPTIGKVNVDGIDITITASAGAAVGYTATAGAGVTLKFDDNTKQLIGYSIDAKGINVTFGRGFLATDLNSQASFERYFGTTATAKNITLTVDQGKDMYIQTGANQGDELRINLDKMDSVSLGIKNSSIAVRDSASNAITEVNNALNHISMQRADLGALQNRLEFKIQNLDISAENLQAAESRIRDLDMAKEMTNFTRQNILAQAATAMLAQANALPQGVLQLLK